MQIITLGTSHGSAEPGRSCTATLLRTSNKAYLFDCGGSVEVMLKNLDIPVGDIRCVFITHMHEDHLGSLSAIAKRFFHYCKNNETVKIFMPEEEGIVAFKSWLNAMHTRQSDDIVSYYVVKPGVIYSDETITVSAIPNDHMQNGLLPSFSYKVEAEGQKIIFTGDISGDFHDYPAVIYEEEFDAVVSELTHFNVLEHVKEIARSKTKQMIFTHVHKRNTTVIDTVRDEIPFPFYVAEDGQSFEV